MELTEEEDFKQWWQEYPELYKEKIIMTQITMMVWSLTKSQTSWNAKSSGPYEASLQTKLVEVMESQLNYLNPERWICESAALNMPANLENSAVATGLEKSVFIPITKKANNCAHLTC